MELRKRPILKRVLTLVLTLVMLLSNMSMSGFAAVNDLNDVQIMDTVQLGINFDKPIVKVGEETIATLNAKAAKNLYGFDLSLKFDATLFDYVSATPKAEFDLSEAGVTHDANGNIHVVGVLKGQSNGVDGDIDLVTVKLKAKDKEGLGNLTLLTGSEFSDGNLALYTLDQDVVQTINIVQVDKLNTHNKIAVISDTHYYAPELGTTGTAFDNYLKSDRKMIAESKAILESTIDSIKNSDAQIVLVSGDLTKDGELLCHQQFAGYLKQLKDAGKKVYVIDGNHDISNPSASSYSGDKATPVPYITPADFKNIYHDYGYGDAVAVDPDSLSYAVDPVPGLRIIAMDSALYDTNIADQAPKTAGALSPSRQAWIDAEIADGVAKGKTVIGMMHHGVTNHFSLESQLFPDYVLQNADQVAADLSSRGMKMVFTGHFHAQDITEKQLSNNQFIFDVETGSLVTYPVPYRLMDLTSDGKFTINTNQVTKVNYDIGNESFQNYAKDFLVKGLNDLVPGMLAGIIMQQHPGMMPDQAMVAANNAAAQVVAPTPYTVRDLLVNALVGHYQGDEVTDSQMLAIYQGMAASSDAMTKTLGGALLSLGTDLAPADNNVILNLNNGTFEDTNATYVVSIGNLTDGSIIASPTSATLGTAINLIITPATGMQLKAGTLKYNDGTDHAISGTSFSMPVGNVTVTAVFEPIPITVTNDQENIVISGNTPKSFIVPYGKTNVTYDLSTFLQAPSSGNITTSALPQMTLSAAVDFNLNGGTPVNVQVQLPQGLIISAPNSWHGKLNSPTVAATNSITVTPTSGSTATVNSVIEVGFGDVPLTFNHAVRLLIPGQAGKKAGYVRSGTFCPISTFLNSDDQSTADSTLADGQEGYINVGTDLVIWTKHFTKFVTYTETTISSTPSGGSSSGGVSTSPSTSATATGIISDPTTGKPIVGANVSLYYALTDRNKTAGKTPDTAVAPPIQDGNSKVSDASGSYSFKVAPATDYYLVATKEGYETYKSPTIAVDQDLVKWDFKMNQSINGVKRLSGLTKVDTALEIAKASYNTKLSNVVLATAENYPDALTGSVLAYKLNAPILLVGSTEVDQAKILTYLKSNLDTTGTVYILGGTAVVSSAMETKMTASGFNHITRLGGIDRYETSVKIADQLGVKTGTPIVLAYGENYPDALSISSIAASMQNPILLVKKDGISDTVKQEIGKIKPSKVYIIGGEGVISATVESQIAQITSLDKTSIVRVAGAERYDTSLAVAQYFNLTGQSICIATGNNFPDALAGSVYAANHNAPIILADGSLSDQALNYLKARKLIGVTLFGGETVVSKDIEQQLGQLIGK